MSRRKVTRRKSRHGGLHSSPRTDGVEISKHVRDVAQQTFLKSPAEVLQLYFDQYRRCVLCRSNTHVETGVLNVVEGGQERFLCGRCVDAAKPPEAVTIEPRATQQTLGF